MKKLLIIDRDGTIIHEPEEEQQVDSLEKLSFIPKVISSLHKIVSLSEYELIMVSNQDGLGTPSFPEETFWPAHNKMLEVLQNEGIVFKDILIDRSFEHENSPGRKPRTGLMKEYLRGDYDLSNSYVIGDRHTDIEFAKNLGARGILIGKKHSDEAVLNTDNWEEIARFLILHERQAEVIRTTRETGIQIKINLDGSGQSDISTGIGFFDHMLEQIARHGDCDLKIKVNGDLHVDEHHTIEDTGLALGEAFNTALGNKKGIQRYGFLLPMDDSIAQVALDLGGRPWLVWEVNFNREKLGEMPTEMFQHFFKSFTDTAKCNLNIKAEGDNDHHKIESIFKAFARSVKVAKERQIENLDRIPSTKGSL